MLSLPLKLLTFGLVGFVINTGWSCVAAISGQLSSASRLAGWPPGPIDLDVLIAALLVSLVASAVSTLLAVVRFASPRV